VLISAAALAPAPRGTGGTIVLHHAGGSFRIALQAPYLVGLALSAHDNAVTESARRGNREWSSPQVHAWTIEDGKASVFWQFQGDQQTEDEFWS